MCIFYPLQLQKPMALDPVIYFPLIKINYEGLCVYVTNRYIYHVELILLFHYLNPVMSNGNGNRKTNMSTFDAYWERCRKQNIYIVGDTMSICYYSNRSIWTGLRKYKIGIRIIIFSSFCVLNKSINLFSNN